MGGPEELGARRRGQLETFLGKFIVMHSDDNLCTKWAEVTSDARRTGRPIDMADAWIAATALLHQVPLVTHNRGHFIGVTGLQLITAAP